MGTEKETFLIRLMQEQDVKGVAAVECDAFSHPWPESIFAEEMTNPLARYLVLEDKSKIVGYAGFWSILGEAQVTNIALMKDVQGLGLGKKLLAALIEMTKEEGAEKILLEVRRSNILAQKLYQKMGFYFLGVRKGYYQDNSEDAFLMQKDLEEGR